MKFTYLGRFINFLEECVKNGRKKFHERVKIMDKIYIDMILGVSKYDLGVFCGTTAILDCRLVYLL